MRAIVVAGRDCWRELRIPAQSTTSRQQSIQLNLSEFVMIVMCPVKFKQRSSAKCRTKAQRLQTCHSGRRNEVLGQARGRDYQYVKHTICRK